MEVLQASCFREACFAMRLPLQQCEEGETSYEDDDMHTAPPPLHTHWCMRLKYCCNISNVLSERGNEGAAALSEIYILQAALWKLFGERTGHWLEANLIQGRIWAVLSIMWMHCSLCAWDTFLLVWVGGKPVWCRNACGRDCAVHHHNDHNEFSQSDSVQIHK